MTTTVLEGKVHDFLDQKRIAVAGVSRNNGHHPAGNLIYRRLKETGHDVFPVNPHMAIVAAATSGSLRAGAQDPGAISPALYADLTWRCTGPFDGGPVASVEGVAGEPGVYTITTPSGGVWKTVDGGDTWTSIERSSVSRFNDPPAEGSMTQPGVGGMHRWVDPANPRRIVRAEEQGIGVSLDEGRTWVSFHHLPIAEVAHLAPREHRLEPAASSRQIEGAPIAVSISDPVRPGLMRGGVVPIGLR